ncbi:MAG: phosphodiester glycosidase family protein, partial [Firmicutes bacterium]|nr:phosphodiester glycosidase family protein [Bacillota bacterium]
MKQQNWKKRITAGCLSAVMALGPVTAYAATFGTQLEQKNLEMTETIRLTNESWYSTYLNDEIVENYVTYKPKGDVTPVIAYGNDIYGAAGFRTVIGYAQEAGQNVIAGINGDYFIVDNGVAVGLVIKDGILRSSESTVANYNSVGFYEDGTVILGRSGLQTKVHFSDFWGEETTFAVHLNKNLSLTSGIVLYTEDFHDTTKATMPSYNVVLRVEEGEPRINETMTGVVVSAGESAEAAALLEGQVVLSMASETSYTSALAKLQELQVGQEVEITFEADEEWEDVVYAVGGGDMLLKDGENVAPTSDKTRAPRTAIGIKNDGSVIFYTVDGRQNGYSRGTYPTELAGRLLELGCVEAINMDGGGSTVMRALYPGDVNTSQVNQPSGGSARACANYIMLVTEDTGNGYAEYLHLYPYSVTMLAGAKQEFTVKATDDAHYAAEVPENLRFSADSRYLGEFDETEDGKYVFTAGDRDYSGQVGVRSGSAYGTAEVTVVENPTSIQLTNGAGAVLGDTMAIAAGDSCDFNANAIYKRRTIVSQDDCYTWEVSGNIGTIDENGVFTSYSNADSSGVITVTAGDISTSITVNVVGKGVKLEDFEGEDFILESGDFLTYTNEDLAYVHNGFASAALTYQFETTTDAALTLSSPIGVDFDKAPGAISFWLYGDKSGNEISLTVDGSFGRETISGGVMDFSGWKRMNIVLPEGTSELISLDLTRNGKLSGTFYVDHLMATYGRYLDESAPEITMEVENGSLTAYVSDNMDTTMTKNNMKLTLDGTPVSFTYNNGVVKADLDVTDGKTHRAALTITDVSGNVARTAVTIDALMVETTTEGAVEMPTEGAITVSADGTPFADTVDHWSNLFDVYLYNQNIASGTPQGEQLMYQPDNKITRMEFAVIVVKWLGLDLDDYSHVKLNFSDASQIPGWAVPFAKAAYGSGIMSGSSNGGKLYFNPQKNVTRQEAMVVIGKTQARGFAEVDLNFADSDQVAAWAAPYVKPLVAQK